MEGHIIADKNNEKIGERITLDIQGELNFAKWRPGKPCMTMTRILEKRQPSPDENN